MDRVRLFIELAPKVQLFVVDNLGSADSAGYANEKGV